MVVKLFLFVLVAARCVLSDQHVSLELNVLDDPATVSSQLSFTNSVVFSHDVNPGFFVDRVTHSGLSVWKSTKFGHKATNALLFVNEHGPRLINLTVQEEDKKSQLLVFLYTLQGWVLLNDVNPFHINLESPESDGDLSSLHLLNGEAYFTKDAPQEDKYGDEAVVLDLNEPANNKFNFSFVYSFTRYTYNYRPKKGFFVKSVVEDKMTIWSTKKDQVVTEIVVDKQSDVSVSVNVHYLDSDVPKSVLFVKNDDGKWESVPTNKRSAEDALHGTTKRLRQPGEFIKPLKRYTVFDYNKIPEPPLCRGCTYEIDGISHNVLYLSTDSSFNKFVDGDKLVYELPDNHVATSSCFYTKNEKILFVDIIYTEDNLNRYLYFEKNDDGYTKLTKPEFDERFAKFREKPVVIDISQESEGYTVKTSLASGVETKLFRPSEGYTAKSVSDGKLMILEVKSYVVEATLSNLGDNKKLLMVLSEEGSFFKYSYYAFYPESAKWDPLSEYLYYKLIDEFSKDMKLRHPSLDISNLNSVRKFVHVGKNELLRQYTFNPVPGVVLSSVSDAGRMIWTPRYPNETCSFVWFNYVNKLLYVISKSDGKVRHYSYEKTGDKWSFINDDLFKKHFYFAYAKSVTVDIKNHFSNKFEVKESGNMFNVTPKNGYLVTRIRYGDRTIWLGSDDLKCTSFYVVYGQYDTYLYLTLTDAKANTFGRYFKTNDADMYKWKECDSKDQCSDRVNKPDLVKTSSKDKSHREFDFVEVKSDDSLVFTKVESKSDNKPSESSPDASKVKSDVAPKKETKKLTDEDLDKLLEEDSPAPQPSGTLHFNEALFNTKPKGSFENAVDNYQFHNKMMKNAPSLEYDQRLPIDNQPFNKSDANSQSATGNYASNTLGLSQKETQSGSSTEQLSTKSLRLDTSALGFNSASPEPVSEPETDSNATTRHDTKLESPPAQLPLVEYVDYTKYMAGIAYLDHLERAEFGQFRDARAYGFNFLVFTPFPNSPIKELRDSYETIWKSHVDACLALSVHLVDGQKKMVELFVKTGTEVVRKHFQYSGYRWLPMTPEQYTYVCQSTL